MKPVRFFNREISWLRFNERVLEEAENADHPLLERVKFMSIFHSNLDEFFMIRVSGLQEQVESGVTEPSRDGLTPREQLRLIRDRVIELRARAWQCFDEELIPALKDAGIRILSFGELTDRQREHLSAYFQHSVFPILTPQAVDAAHPFPHISNLSLNLIIVVESADGTPRFARVKVPQILPRLIRVPLDGTKAGRRKERDAQFIWLEDLIAANLGELFPGMRVLGYYPFRVIRDADIEIREDEADDLLQGIERVLRRRRFGSVAQLEVHSSIPDGIEEWLITKLRTPSRDCYRSDGALGLSSLMELTELDRPDLKFKPYRARLPGRLTGTDDIFAAIRSQDVLLHHPFDTFEPVVDFVTTAAHDPNVLAIKQTIYRVGSQSPVVAALQEAVESGKQVAAIVELKARFDEENNLVWARSLEAAGVHVVYSDIRLKVHCKLLMVVRREGDVVRRYIHLGTGNYNARTAQMYTDFGLFTCDPEIADDVSLLFNALTGYSERLSFRKLLVSPKGIRSGLMERVRREMEWARRGEAARLIFKMNSLTDFDCAECLYEASSAGVQIDLIVRGSCCLVPGVPGMSENIRVRSIVGRYLEHDRVFYFRNGGNEEVWLGSADLMPRNLDRRYEVVFPVEDPKLRHWLAHVYLHVYLRDNTTARMLNPDGTYTRLTPDGETPVNAQEWFMTHSNSSRTLRVPPER